MTGDRSGDARPVKPLAALLALAAGVGASIAVAASGSTELGGTTDAPVYGAEAPVVESRPPPERSPTARRTAC